MKKLDTSILNQNILDESFSNFSSSDVVDLRNKISSTEKLISDLKRQLLGTFSIPLKVSIKGKVVSLEKDLSNYKSQLASIPKSIIDAVDNQIKLQQDLSDADKNKLTAAELAAIEKQNQDLKDKIDKAKGITDVLGGKSNSEVSTTPNVNKEEIKTSFFTVKNTIITLSILAVLSIGTVVLIKKLKK